MDWNCNKSTHQDQNFNSKEHKDGLKLQESKHIMTIWFGNCLWGWILIARNSRDWSGGFDDSFGEFEGTKRGFVGDYGIDLRVGGKTQK